jgi:hypothetical protein
VARFVANFEASSALRVEREFAIRSASTVPESLLLVVDDVAVNPKLARVSAEVAQEVDAFAESLPPLLVSAFRERRLPCRAQMFRERFWRAALPPTSVGAPRLLA